MLTRYSVFGRVLPGWVGDHLGRFNAMLVMNYFSAIVVLALWIPAHSNAGIIVFSCLYGFGTGALVSLGPSLIAQISDVRQIGVRTGTMFSIISVAALVGNPIGGALVTHWNGKFTGLQIFTGVIMFGGATSILASRIAVGGFGIKAKV
jgi:MFS family permease